MAIYIAKKKAAAPTLDGDAVAGNVLSGKTFYSDSTTKKTGSMTNNGAVSPSALSAGSSYTVPAGYHNGSGVVTTQTLAAQTGVDTGKTAIDSSHVLTGYQGWVNGTKVSGSYTPSSSNIQASKSATAGTTAIDVTPDSGYDAMAKVVVSPTPSETKTDGPNVSTTKDVTPTSGKLLSKVTINPLTHTGYSPSSSSYTSITMGTSQTIDLGANHDKRYVRVQATGPSGTKDATGTPLTTNGDHTISGLSSYTGVKVNVNVPNPTLSGTATASDVLSTKTFYSDSYTKQTGSITSKAAATYNTSSSDQTISSGQYLSGTQTIKAVTTENIEAGNIKSGVTIKVGDANDDDRILSVTGTYTGGELTPTTLWNNPAPTSSLSAGNITLSQSYQNFKFLRVTARISTSKDTSGCTMISKEDFANGTTGTSSTSLAIEWGVVAHDTTTRYMRYLVPVSNTQIYISTSYTLGSSSTSGNRCIITKIEGLN